MVVWHLFRNIGHPRANSTSLSVLSSCPANWLLLYAGLATGINLWPCLVYHHEHPLPLNGRRDGTVQWETWLLCGSLRSDFVSFVLLSFTPPSPPPTPPHPLLHAVATAHTIVNVPLDWRRSSRWVYLYGLCLDLAWTRPGAVVVWRASAQPGPKRLTENSWQANRLTTRYLNRRRLPTYCLI